MAFLSGGSLCAVQRISPSASFPSIVLESEKSAEVTAWPPGIFFHGCLHTDIYTNVPPTQSECALSHLSEWFIQLLQDALLIKHLSLVAVLVVVVDLLPEICWKFVEGHVLLHLLVLRQKDTEENHR